MLERGIDLATIGFVFAAAPLAKALIRLAGAAIADSLGDRVIYIFSSAADFLLSLVYLFSTSAAGFAAGKLLDGARETAIWSAIRPSLMAASPEKKHFVLADMLSGRLVYNAFGSLAVGALFAFGGYELPLVALVTLSAYMVFSSLKLRNFHKAEARVKLADFNPFGRSGKFYEIAGVFIAGGALYHVAFYVLLPIYFSTLGFTLGEISLIYAGYFLILGGTLHIITHRRLETAKAAVAGVAIFCSGMAGVTLAQSQLVPHFFLFMAFGDACLAMLWEQMNYIGARESKKRATDLSLLVMPCLLVTVAAAALSGVAADALGFAPIFALVALSEIAFAAWCMRLAVMDGAQPSVKNWVAM
jgi:hypothetical protein